MEPTWSGMSLDELEAQLREMRIAAGLPPDRTVFECCGAAPEDVKKYGRGAP